MIQSELADELGVTPSTVRKWILIHAQLTGHPVERRLDAFTVATMQRAHALVQERPGMPFREALERVLGQYTEPVPPESVRELMGRLDALDQALTRLEDRQATLQANQESMQEQLEAIASYLKKVVAHGSDSVPTR